MRNHCIDGWPWLWWLPATRAPTRGAPTIDQGAQKRRPYHSTRAPTRGAPTIRPGRPQEAPLPSTRAPKRGAPTIRPGRPQEAPLPFDQGAHKRRPYHRPGRPKEAPLPLRRCLVGGRDLFRVSLNHATRAQPFQIRLFQSQQLLVNLPVVHPQRGRAGQRGQRAAGEHHRKPG